MVGVGCKDTNSRGALTLACIDLVGSVRFGFRRRLSGFIQEGGNIPGFSFYYMIMPPEELACLRPQDILYVRVLAGEIYRLMAESRLCPFP